MRFFNFFKKNAQTEPIKMNVAAENKAPKTFVCQRCGQTLPIKYFHKNNCCEKCNNKSNVVSKKVSRSGRFFFEKNNNVKEYEILLPKTLFELSDSSVDLPRDNVLRTWSNVVITESGDLSIEKHSITYSAHSIGHNTGRSTTYRPISFGELPKVISLSNDKNAKKYIGMNQHNWREYVKEPVSSRIASKYPLLRFGKYDWYVLRQYDDNSALLLSKYGIDTRPWNTEQKLVPWKESTLFQWLNTEFIQMYFSKQEQDALIAFSNNSLVSIPDKQLIEAYLKKDSALTVLPTPQALKNGAFSYTYSGGQPDFKRYVGNGLYWLKDTYKGENVRMHTWAHCVYWNGSICMYPFDHNKVVVRPLIKVALNKL